MRRASTIALLLVAALAAQGACFAQAPAAPRDGAVHPATHAPATTADASPAPATADDIASDDSRSAFGKVMDVMIGALQRQSRERARPARAVRTTAAGTPMGIQVGAAFRDAMSGDTARDVHRAGKQKTGTGGAAAATVPRAAPPEDLVLRQATLAGPG